ESGPSLSPNVAGHPLRPATRLRLGGPLPRQRADRPRAPPPAPEGFPSQGMPPKKRMRYYPAVGPAIPHTRAGRSRVTHPFAGRYCYRPRLACVKHAASVRPEPGSNSPREFVSSIESLSHAVNALAYDSVSEITINVG